MFDQILITHHRAPLDVIVPPGLSCIVDRGKPGQRSMINYLEFHAAVALS